MENTKDIPNTYEVEIPYIFISYAHKDSARVLTFVSEMQQAGLHVWFDKGIEVGAEWPENIEHHLENADYVVVFMSEAAVSSVNCRNEINLALSENKKILIVFLEETVLRHGMKLQLSSIQSVFAYDGSNDARCAKELSTLVQVSIERVSAATSTSNGATLSLSKNAKMLKYEGTKLVRCDKRYKIDSVIIPDGTTSISSLAFHCHEKITSVYIPDSVTELGVGAFWGCESLENINIPRNIKSIGSEAFCNTRITSVVIPSSVEEMGWGVFQACNATIYCELLKPGTKWDEEWLEYFDGTLYWADEWYYDTNGVPQARKPSGVDRAHHKYPKISTEVIQKVEEEWISVFDTLMPREVDIIRLLFGLTGESPMSPVDISKKYDVCVNRIYQIEAKFLRKIRHQKQYPKKLNPHNKQL